MQGLKHSGLTNEVLGQIVFLLIAILLPALINYSFAQKINKDTSIGNRIFLNDFTSIDAVFSLEENDFKLDTLNNLSCLIYNHRKEKKQYLKLYTYPGNGCCQYFEVGYLLKTKKELKTTLLRFETESGVRLGMSLQEFAICKDTSKMEKSYQNNLQAYYYNEFREKQDKSIGYSARWFFKDGILVKFGFGETAYHPEYSPPSARVWMSAQGLR